MVVCGIALAVLLVVWGVNKRVRQGVGRQVFLILVGASVLGIISGISEAQEMALVDGRKIQRAENGEGSYESQLQFSLEDNEEVYDYLLEIPEQLLTREEEWEYLKAAREEVEQEFPGENPSMEQIRDRVTIRDTYQDGRVEAEWSFDNIQIMDMDGNVIAEELPEEGILVQAEVTLRCGEAESSEVFAFRVLPPILTEEEQIFRELESVLEQQAQTAGEEYLELPQEILGQSASWQEKRSHLSEQILVLGVIIACLIPFLKQSKEKELQKERNRLLILEYPDMVSKLALLLSAGMTVQGAWKKIAFAYEKKHENNAVACMPVYEEMLTACRELESGMGEERVYERFGERCGQPGYRRLGSILTQNLRKGSHGLVRMLEEEAANAFEERKQVAKQYGEEAGTKLLMPMILMLGIVMVLLIVPAILSFQM